MPHATSKDGQARIHRATSDDGTEIAGRAHGQGPPLVLVPGAMADGEFVWDSLLPLLTDHFTCYAMSPRGRGPLSDPSTDLAPERRVQDVTAFVESIGEPVGLVGWSGSGLLALGAVQNTDAVLAVAVYEPVVFEVMSEDEFIRFQGTIARMGERAKKGRMVDAARTFIDVVANDDEMTADVAQKLVEGCAQNVPVFLQEQQQLFETGYPSPTDPSELAKITVPVLLLHGTRSIPDPWFIDSVHHVAEHVPDASVREISGAGHFGPTHQPKTVADELVRFFEARLAEA